MFGGKCSMCSIIASSFRNNALLKIIFIPFVRFVTITRYCSIGEVPRQVDMTPASLPEFPKPSRTLDESRKSVLQNPMFFYLNNSAEVPYTPTLILVNLILVKSFSCLVTTSQGVGVATWEFARIVLLCLLYLPIPITGQNSSNGPQLFSPIIVAISFFKTITCSA